MIPVPVACSWHPGGGAVVDRATGEPVPGADYAAERSHGLCDLCRDRQREELRRRRERRAA